MRVLVILLLLILCSPVNADKSILPSFGTALHLTLPKQRIKAPEFSLSLLDNKKLALGELNGKIILLNFWATYCGSCREEMPALQALWEKYTQQGLVVIAISIEKNNIQVVKEYIDNKNISFPIAVDINKMHKLYEVEVLPTSYIIGRDGKFIAKVVGSREWSSNESFDYFENLLNNKD